MDDSMRVGVDFDNTIVCYDSLFPRIAREQGLVPDDVPETKADIRNYLRAADREDDWTELQGYVYGPRMEEAEMFPGVLEFFRRCAELRIETCIISHKTRKPYIGPDYDLHTYARQWIDSHAFYDRGGLTAERVFFELTKEAKIERIRSEGCSCFIDDLPEFLAEPAFPDAAERILFDPKHVHADETRFVRLSSWTDITAYIAQEGRNHG